MSPNKKREYLAPSTEVVMIEMQNVILETSGNIEDSIENPVVGW